MKKCSFCGADLPQDARFCNKCGSATDAAATVSNTLQPPSWMPEGGTIAAAWSPYTSSPSQSSEPTWSPNAHGPVTPPPVAQSEDERRRGIPPWSPLYGAALGGEALLGSGQIYTPGAPVVPGTPQLGSVPGITGTPPPYTNAPASPPAPGNAPVTHPVQGPGNASISHPIQGPTHAPISHPVQGPVNTPHPQPGPQPIHQLPEQPEPPPTHKHHRHHKHSEEQEHHQHQTHPARHELHRAARVTKVAGGSTVKTILIVLVAVAVVAAGGIATAMHFLSNSSGASNPQPLISISSNYTVGNTLAGAAGTSLHISGQQFSSNSAITFLLDGQVAPGNPGTRSDSNGNFSTDVAITNVWSVGTHTLTARDGSNHSTKNSVSVTIVQPGQANTPGPHGAPPDDASFRLNDILKVPDPNSGQPFASNPVLIITGHPDPDGGTVCSPDDNGQSFTYNGANYNTGTPYTEVSTATCSGTYKSGQINYVETVTSLEISFQYNGVNVNCMLNSPAVILRLTGAYSGNNTFSGTINFPFVPYTCDQGWNFHQIAFNGTWTGTIVNG